MDDTDLERAPRWRGALAGLTDAAVTGVAVWGLRGRSGVAASVLRVIGPASPLVREQLGSPGQRLLGIRTVDRRTGARTSAWRSLAAAGLGAGGQVLAARLQPPAEPEERRLERQRFHEAMSETYRRHSTEPEAGAAERARLLTDAPPGISVNIWRSVAPQVAVGVAASRLRRRLVSTTEIRRR